MTVRAVARDGSHALRSGFWVAMLLGPTWLTYGLRSIQLDLRSVAAVYGLLLLIVVPRRDGLNPLMRYRPAASDLLMLFLFGSILMTQFLKETVAPLTPFNLARQWLLPYVVGRFFLLRSSDIEDLAPTVFKVIGLVAVLGVIEALFRKNLVNELLGMRFGLLEQGEGYRWGMKRAQGATRHPIYNGMMLVMLFPWAVECYRYCRRGAHRALWKLTPVLCATACFFAVSRGPHAALIVTIGSMLFFRVRFLRVPLATLGIIAGLTLFTMYDELIEFAGRLAGETEESVRIIYIDGEPYEYTGTKHRELLNIVYADAIREAGWIGWGAGLRGVEIDPNVAQRFGSVDNHYLLHYLRYGYIGAGAFILLALGALFQSLWCSWNTTHGRSTLAAGLCGAFIGVGILMKSVWFDPDYGSVWLFCAGLSGCLLRLQDDEPLYEQIVVQDQQEAHRRQLPRRNLTPAWTPMATS